ncbi:MAG: XdhC family protein [Candidatus Omnitrophica bacterium]|nr:XdhC family protein [Candidatus Omnitrophota bacterium]
MDHDLLLKALEASRNGRSYAFATVVETTEKGTPRKPGAKMLVLEDGSFWGTVGGGRTEKKAQIECKKAITCGKINVLTFKHFGRKNQSICGGQTRILIEPFKGVRKFIICGGGHIGLQLSVIAKMLNFEVVIIDNRKDFASKGRFPHADKIVKGDFARSLGLINITAKDHIMIATYGHEHDYVCLKKALQTKAGYIGLICSRVKKIKFFKSLKKNGFSDNDLSRISAPAGIDIGSQTPEEIAVSIAGEVIEKNNQSMVGSAKFKEKHEKGK